VHVSIHCCSVLGVSEMLVLPTSILLILIRCSQAARDEAEQPEEALRSLGGLLQKYIVKAHSREGQSRGDPGLNLTVQQTVTLHHDGTGSKVWKQQSIGNENDTTGSPTLQILAPSQGTAPLTPEGAERNKEMTMASPAEQLLSNRTILGDIDPAENDPTAETMAWNPDAMCDGEPARYRADLEKRQHRSSEWQARRAVMKKYSRKFLSWNPYKTLYSVTGEKAEEAAESTRKRTGMSLDAARQLVMYEYPEKFAIGGKACAWVIDGGSSGGRLYRFTEQDFCPQPVEVPLTCENDAEDYGIIAFSGTNTANGNVLRFRDVIGNEAEVLPRDFPEWLKDKPITQPPGRLEECYLYSLATAIKAQDSDCARTSLFIGVTAGFRDYKRNSSELVPPIEQAGRLINRAVDTFNRMLSLTLKNIAPRTKNWGGLQVLPISREGQMEAESVRIASQVCGDSAIKDAAGVFSMGGKSAQFTSFKSGRFTLLLTMGHLKGTSLLDVALKDGIKSVEELRIVFRGSLLPMLKDAREDKDAPDLDHWSDFTDGLWIGIQGTAWAAVMLGILPSHEDAKDEKHAPVSRAFVQEKVNEKLRSREWASVLDNSNDKRDLAQLLIMDFWLKEIFTDNTQFYFRKKWATETGRCLAAEWTFSAAQSTQPLLSQALQDEADMDQPV